MQLMTEQLREQIPAIGATESQGDHAKCLLKYFTPDSNWSWWVLEFDGSDLFFGAVSGLEFEIGYFRLSELMEIRGPLGLPVERDLYFKPTPLSEIRKQYAR